MPKSKRDKKISLTKTTKKGLELKQHVVTQVRSCVEKYKTILLFSVDNMRSDKLTKLRIEWRDSRFFLGKNKVIALALGKTPEAEIADGISQLSSELKGEVGLLFTNESKKTVLKRIEEYEDTSYARAGYVATETVEIPAGPLPVENHTIESYLRQLGMPTALKSGMVTLLSDYTVCKEGQALTPEQARILKILDMKITTFKIKPLGIYTKKSGYQHISNNEECL